MPGLQARGAIVNIRQLIAFRCLSRNRRELLSFVRSQVFDHTSVIRFIETRFGVYEPNITAWRRAVCGDLTTAFDFRTPDSRIPPLPDTSNYKSRLFRNLSRQAQQGFTGA